MSLTIEPKQGIRLNLSSYSKIRSYQGGGEFWEHENQQVVMQYLGEFLPRAVENEGGKSGTVLFTHLVNGKDVLSQSTALGSNGEQAPAEQLNRLRDAIARLKAKETDPLIDPNARKLIEAFRLPDPQKDPELYRIASGSTRRLLVLWGVEKESNSALTPQAAVARLPVAGGMPVWLERLLWLLLILLLLGLFWWWWNGRPEPQPSADLGTDSVVVVNPQSPSRTALDPGTTAVNPNSTPDSRNNASGVTGSNAPLPAGQSPPPTTSGNSAVTSINPAGAPTSTRPFAEPNPATVPAGSPMPGGSNAPTDPTSPPPSSKSTPPTKPTPTDVDRIRNTEGQPLAPGSKAPTDQKTPTSEAPPQPGVPPGTQPPAPAPMPADPASKTPPPAEPSTIPPTTALPENMKLEITNSRTSAEPRNGKVEVVLTAVGRDTNGEPVAVTAVERWTIDGKEQKDAAGKSITSTTMPIALTKGTYKVAVEGTDRSGKPVKAEADVEVGIQVTEKTDVKVRPRK